MGVNQRLVEHWTVHTNDCILMTFVWHGLFSSSLSLQFEARSQKKIKCDQFWGKSIILPRTKYFSWCQVNYFSYSMAKKRYYSYGYDVLVLLSAPSLKMQHWREILENIYIDATVC